MARPLECSRRVAGAPQRMPTRMRASPSVGPAQVGQCRSAPRQSVRLARRPTAGGAVQGRAVTIRGRKGKLEIANLPAGTPRFQDEAFDERSCCMQVLAFVLFDPPARPGGSLPRGGPPVPAAQPGLSVQWSAVTTVIAVIRRAVPQRRRLVPSVVRMYRPFVRS